MICPKCDGNMVEKDTLFECEQCENSIEKTKECPVCFTENPISSEECSNCGYNFETQHHCFEIYKDSPNFVERFKSSSGEEKGKAIGRWSLYILTLILFIMCVSICTTPLAYNAKYVSTSSNSSIVFKRNNICKYYEGSSLYAIGSYIAYDEYIVLDNGANQMEIVNRGELKSSYAVYELSNIGEGFLVAFTVIFGILSIAVFLRNYLKVNSKR